jgi:hypothetical protein
MNNLNIYYVFMQFTKGFFILMENIVICILMIICKYTNCGPKGCVLLNFSLTELERLAANSVYNGRAFHLLYESIQKLKQYVDVSSVTYIYPKNLFNKEKDIEIYAFTESKIISVVLNRVDENKLNVFDLTFKRRSDINSIELTEGSEYNDELKLNVVFSDSSNMCFNSKEDTNDHHAGNFKKLLQDIVEFIL